MRIAAWLAAGAIWVRQKSGTGRSRSLPSKAGIMLTPSMVRSAGSGMPTISRAVEKMSEPITGVSLTVPGLICPGHRTSPATRMPPS